MSFLKVSLRGITDIDQQYTFNLHSGITSADEGKAVTIDTSAANTVKLAGSGDPIFGRLEKVEDRTVQGVLVGTVVVAGVNPITLPYTGTVAVGDYVAGSATAGSVATQALDTDVTAGITHTINDRRNWVVEVDPDGLTGQCVVFFV